MHIFEFYEETFPEHCLLGQSSSCENSEQSDAQRKQTSIGKNKSEAHNSHLTTPTDVETPAKEMIANKA